MRNFNDAYAGEYLNRIAFPLGGIGSGMICLEGTGALSHLSIKHSPKVDNEAPMFAAICIKGEKNTAKLLEGAVPNWKKFRLSGEIGTGGPYRDYGLPHFRSSSFETRFPFADLKFEDEDIPLNCSLTGWSPFIPNEGDNSSLPAMTLEYTFENPTQEVVEAVFSYHSGNIIKQDCHSDKETHGFRKTKDGFQGFYASEEKPYESGSFAVSIDDPEKVVDYCWFRGVWFDAMTVLWKNISEGKMPANEAVSVENPSPGGSIYVPVKLAPGEVKTIKVNVSWYVPASSINYGGQSRGPKCVFDPDAPKYKPWYAVRFDSIESVNEYYCDNIDELRSKSLCFSDTFYNTDLAPEAIEAAAANLSILKSTTVLREEGGRIWAWEGCCDSTGSCAGSCNHVWNYAQAMCHLFPELERTLRQSEFHEDQDESGHQNFRTWLPIRKITDHGFHAAADGQLGGIMKMFREWRISGDNNFLKEYWPLIKSSLDFCIKTWDPDQLGILIEPHHNTYDIEFWGPDGMCTSFYLGALKAAAIMAEAMNDTSVNYAELYQKGREYTETELWNGEYFIQQIQWKGMKNIPLSDIAELGKERNYSEEALQLLIEEGPKYQYGNGCLSDGVLGAWMAETCGVGEILDPAKVASHLKAIHKYNLKHDLSTHANPQRPTYAVGKEGGLLLCSWPKGDKLTLPFVYSDEVWTGIEYQVASHLIMMGMVEEGLEIVQVCRKRYDGKIRNPFDEYECGHWYARAMASYALLQALSGARYDALEKVLYLEPKVKGDFKSFICTESGFGTVGVKDGKPFFEIASGQVDINEIKYKL